MSRSLESNPDQEFYLSHLNDQTPAYENPAVLALEESEVSTLDGFESYKPGDFVKLDYLDDINGIAAIMPGSLFDESPDRIMAEERNSGGFHFTNGSAAEYEEARNSNIEVKARFPNELRDYPEDIHVHNVPEWYFGVGSFEMLVGNEEMPDDPETVHDEIKDQEFQDVYDLANELTWFDIQNFEDEVFRVGAGQYHGITSKDEDAYLGIVRGDPQGYERWIGKWDLEGNQFYDHFEEEPEINQIRPIGD